VASIDLRAIEDELGAERKSILKEDLVARLADDLGTERLHVLITCIERLEPTLEERTLCARLLISALSRGATPMSVTIPLLGELASAGVEPAAATNALLSALEKQPRWSYEILQQLDRLADVRLRSRVQQALIDLIRTSRDVELAIESARHLVLWPVTGEEKCLDDARAALLSRVPDCRSGAAADRLASVALEAMNGTDERESHEVVTDALLSARRLGVAMALLKRTSVTATRAPTVTNHLIELLTSAGPDVDAELAMDAIRACLELDPSGARRVSLTGMLMNWVADDLDSRTVIAACRLLWEVSADENTIRQAAAQAIERVPVVPANSLSLIEILLASNPDAQLVGQIRKRAVELVERVSAREQVERLHEALAALNERGEGAPIRAALLSRLRVQTDVTAAERIVDGLGGVVPHLESDAWVRQAVTVELMSSKNSEVSACLMKILCSLGPDLEVLRQAEILPIPATRAFLASIRSASDVDGWIALLPLLRGEAVTRSRTPS